MGSHRFYIQPEQWNPEHLELDSAEGHHCVDVVRCQVGDRVVAFNGRGAEATAEITAIAGGAPELKTISVQKSEPLGCEIALGQAIPKGKNMELIVQKATELGVNAIFPILSDRTIVRADAEDAKKKADKWQKVAIEACKQSGQNWLPNVSVPKSLDETLAAVARDFDLLLIASLEDDAQSLGTVLAEAKANDESPSKVLVLIGPEGDFTPAEIGTAKSHGCLPLSLGPIVLRTETAAIYSLSVLGYELRQKGDC